MNKGFNMSHICHNLHIQPYANAFDMVLLFLEGQSTQHSRILVPEGPSTQSIFKGSGSKTIPLMVFGPKALNIALLAPLGLTDDSSSAACSSHIGWIGISSASPVLHRIPTPAVAAPGQGAHQG